MITTVLEWVDLLKAPVQVNQSHGYVKFARIIGHEP